jgi:hypothetical protein
MFARAALGLVAAVICSLLTITPLAAATAVQINAGGPAFTTTRGQFLGDSYFTGGALATYSARAIDRSADDALYLTVHAGTSFAVSVPVPNGRYDLKLHFAECSYGSAGQRVMDVRAQGQLVLSAFDIYKTAGAMNRAVVVTIPITVSAGKADLAFASRIAGRNAVVAAVELRQTTTTPFTIVALPDTQYYSSNYPNIFKGQTEWIANQVTARNIKLVIGLGDIVDNASEAAQWNDATAAIGLLSGHVPYVAAIGNHDYDTPSQRALVRSAASFNQHFGPAFYRSATWYKGSYPAGSNENFYGIVTINGKQYLIIALEFYPRAAALDWANRVVSNYPDLETWVVTHSYVYSDNSHLSRCDAYDKTAYGLVADNNGDEVWQKFVSKHSNITLVLSGHVNDAGVGRRVDIGAAGTIVNQMLSNYQAYPNGGNGYLRLLEFRPAEDKIYVKSYSPYLGQYMTDARNQFWIHHHNPGVGGDGTHVFTGKVRNESCVAVAGARVSASGAAATTDSQGKFSITASSSKWYTPVKVSVEGTSYSTHQTIATQCESVAPCPFEAFLKKTP